MRSEAFDRAKWNEYAARAKAAWGDTPAYREYRERAKGRTAEEEDDIGRWMTELFRAFGEIRDTDPAGEKPQALVRKLQEFITEHLYTCTREILSGLGQMYAAGGELTENIDRAGGEGTAAFAAKAIGHFCGEQGCGG